MSVRSWRKASWSQRTVRNWRWWLSLPLLVPVLPGALVSLVASWATSCAYWISYGADVVDRWVQNDMPGGQWATNYLKRLLAWVKKDYLP